MEKISDRLSVIINDYPLFSQSKKKLKDILVLAKLSLPYSGNRSKVWVISYDKSSKQAFGLITWITDPEWWFVDIGELEGFKHKLFKFMFWSPAVRLHEDFKPMTIRELKRKGVV